MMWFCVLQLIPEGGAEKTLAAGCNGCRKHSTLVVSGLTDSKWTAKRYVWWPWICSCTESQRAEMSCTRTSREGSETLWLCRIKDVNWVVSAFILDWQKWDLLAWNRSWLWTDLRIAESERKTSELQSRKSAASKLSCERASKTATKQDSLQRNWTMERCGHLVVAYSKSRLCNSNR